MSQATYEDVNLILKLYEMRRDEKLRAARAWFLAECKPKNAQALLEICPPASENNARFRMVVSYWDMVASFVTAGVLNEELLAQSGNELLLTWERLKPLANELRAFLKDPGAWRHLETVGNSFAERMKKRGAYEGFLERVVGG
jgi:hypothetical protein